MTSRVQDWGQISLDSKLSTTPIPKSLRRAIIESIFDTSLTEHNFEAANGFHSYFYDWYEDQVQAAACHTSIMTYGELLNILSHIRLDQSRENLLDKLLQDQPLAEKERLDASINLAAKLWMTVSIGHVKQALPSGSVILWEKGRLSETVYTTLWPQPQLSEKIKLPRTFTAANLERIAGLEIGWTSNLADHLCLKDDDKRVMLYHQVSFLELHQKNQTAAFPPHLIEETLSTLGLLIPTTDKRSRTWFHQKQRTLNLDPKAGSYGPLPTSARQIEHFHFWRDRLIILKQTFDEVEPHTLSLWWNDDRKKVQWYTFWVAALVLVLTVVFGLVQCAAGVVQAWASMKSLQS
ncbi:hypothetical protein ACLMJK_003451 [Lecanora helva]